MEGPMSHQMPVQRPIAALRLVVFLLLAALPSAVASAGVPVPVGGEFQVNTETTGRQWFPAVAVDADGDFIVVWTNGTWHEPGASSIRGQRFDSAGSPVGGEFQVNTETAWSQLSPAVAAHAGGDFVVVWTSRSPDGSSSSIQGRRFDSAGAPIGSQFQVDTDTPSDGSGRPAVAVDGGGRFVVVWQGYLPDPEGYPGADNILGRRFDSAGAAVGELFQVNTFDHYGQSEPAVAAAVAGDFVVVWGSYLSSGGDYHSVQGQRFDPAGASAGDQFQVNSFGWYCQPSPAVAVAGDGAFVVVWTSYLASGSGPPYDTSVQGQRFDAAGSPAGGQFQVNATPLQPPTYSAVAAAGNGGFVVVWHGFGAGGSDASANPVQGQHFDSAGATAGDRFQVNTTPTDGPGSPALAADDDGDFVVVWHSEASSGSDSSLHSIQGQRFATACTAGPHRACLLAGRFRVEGSMDDFSSPPRSFDLRVMSFPAGRAESDQAVFFESFSPGNFELGVKMVDGCGLPEGHPLRTYWAFVGGLTNAAAQVAVEDTVTGQRWSWANPAGRFPRTVGDTSAFPCTDGAPSAPCVQDGNTACLLDRRFKVGGWMEDFSTPPRLFPLRVMGFPAGRAESDQAVFFESFSAGNFEVGVKMVDGCGFPAGHPLRSYWVFYGGLTNAQTRVEVTQVSTLQVDVWENPAGVFPLTAGRTRVFPCE